MMAIGCVFEVGNWTESAFSADEPEERLCQKAREVAARRALAESAEEESVLALEWLFRIRADSANDTCSRSLRERTKAARDRRGEALEARQSGSGACASHWRSGGSGSFRGMSFREGTGRIGFIRWFLCNCRHSLKTLTRGHDAAAAKQLREFQRHITETNSPEDALRSSAFNVDTRKAIPSCPSSSSDRSTRAESESLRSLKSADTPPVSFWQPCRSSGRTYWNSFSGSARHAGPE
jgi:hypothetical protein